MILLILVGILMVVAILERVLYIKKYKIWERLKWIVVGIIIFLLFTISYFITDTALDLIYIFVTMIIFLGINVINMRTGRKSPKYLLTLIGIPIFGYLIINSASRILIQFSYVMLIAMIVNAILGYSYKTKVDKIDVITSIIALVITLSIFYFLYSDKDEIGMLKQEVVAAKFLEEELNIEGKYIHTRNLLNIHLRGEEIEVVAYDLSDNIIKMIYKNNEIIDYDIIDNYY